jgi:hypothetical protein
LERADTAVFPSRRGLLVPVANPDGVAPLLAVAFAATAPDDPPARVVAFVRRESGTSSGATPHPPALTTAREYAATRAVPIAPHAVWSSNAGADIVTVAREANVRWILLGYHRAASGNDTMGGVVRDVFATARAQPVHVGVFIQGTDQPFERIYAAVDSGHDGRAALDLAVRITRSSNAKLRALLVSSTVSQPDEQDDMADLLRDARRSLGRRFHSDVLSERSLDALLHQSPGRLLIVGKKLADEIRLPLDEVPEGDRCVIVVQGA